MAIVLASQSPRRKELMRLITSDFVVDAAKVDERSILAGSPAELAQKLAVAKAQPVAARRPDDIVVGCDTLVELDGRVLGKPADEATAIAMLTALSGRTHLVHTGVCICRYGASTLFTETTEVAFLPIPTKAVLAYAKTTEPYDKAGGYGIQGAAAKYIPHICGCYYNVMGLPVAALHTALVKLGGI